MKSKKSSGRIVLDIPSKGGEYGSNPRTANGDGGSPLFTYDGVKNGFRVVGIFGSYYLDSEGAGHAMVANWTALTPQIVDWIHAFENSDSASHSESKEQEF